MQVLSVNVAMPQLVNYRGQLVSTGIFKTPVAGRVRLDPLNLDGDRQADLVNHGGPYRAAYVYSMDNYRHWQQVLQRDDLTYGQFGENFTVEGLPPEDEICIGDVFRVGGALVQVTQPRPPCYKLGMKMGLPTFPKRFLASGRVGFYLRVLQAGDVGAGDAFEQVSRDPVQMSVRQVANLLFFEQDNLADARRALDIEALSPGWRQSFAERVAQAE